MERVVVVEVLGRRGEVSQRVRLTQLPATIGRGWTSDVVVGDPTVDAAHARIVSDEAGALTLEDLGSVNGIQVGPSREKLTRIALNGLVTVRLGRAALRIVSGDQPVPPAIPDHDPTGRLAWLLATPGAMAATIAAGVVLIGLTFWLGSYEAKAGAGVAGQVVAFVAATAIWAGIWSFAGRLSVHQFRFWQHGALTWLVVLALLVWNTVESYADFLAPGQEAAQAAGGLVAGGLVVALIAAQLGLVSGLRRGRRIAVAVVLTTAFTGLAVLAGKAAKHDLAGGTVPITATLEPLPASVIPARSVDDFVQRTNALKQGVDRLVKTE